MAKNRFDFNSSIDTSSIDEVERFAFNFPNSTLGKGESLNPNYAITPWEQVIDQPPEPYGPLGDLAVPHVSTFAGIYNAAIKSYYYYFDESLRDSWQNSLAMQRDGFIKEIRLSRELPACMLPFHLQPDDEDDPGQAEVAKEMYAIVKNCWRFQNIRKTLAKATFYGKSASHFAIGTKKVHGQDRNVITNHIPINGDKLRYKFDGTPGIAIYPEFRSYFESKYGEGMVEGDNIVQNTNIGPALFMKTKYLRDRFIIHEYNPSDTDYFFEYDMAASVHGIGWRSDYYWTWQILTELRAWNFEGLERVGVNGMLIGFFKTGNPQAKARVWEALLNLQKSNMAVFEVDASWNGSPADVIQRLEPASVGYDIIYNLQVHFEDIIRRGVLGQNLSTKSAATGLGSGTADLQGESKFDVIKSDAMEYDETYNSDMIPILLKYNYFKYNGKRYRGDELPFGLRFESQTDDPNIEKVITAAEKLINIGVELDGEDLRDRSGFSPPKSSKTTISLAKMTEAGLTPQEKDPTLGMMPPEQNGKPSGNGKAGTNGKSSGDNSSGSNKPKSEAKSKPEKSDKSDKHSLDLAEEIDRNLFEHENELIDVLGTYLVSIKEHKHIVRAAWSHVNQSICIYVNKFDEVIRSKLKIIENTLGLGKVKILPDKLGSKLEPGYQDMHLDMFEDHPVQANTTEEMLNNIDEMLKTKKEQHNSIDGTHAEHAEDVDNKILLTTGEVVPESVEVRKVNHVKESDFHKNENGNGNRSINKDKHSMSIRSDAVPPSEAGLEMELAYGGESSETILKAAQEIRDNDDSPSIMIAFYPSSKVAKAIRYDSDGAESLADLHMTLFYLGRMSDLGEEVVEAARKACHIYAEYAKPFHGIIRNLGLFPSGEQFTYNDQQEVLYAQVESVELTEFRHTLAQVLNISQVPHKTDFTFNPHITLKYQDVGTGVPELWFAPQLVDFDSMTFVVGDDREEIMLGKRAKGNDSKLEVASGTDNLELKYDLSEVLSDIND